MGSGVYHDALVRFNQLRTGETSGDGCKLDIAELDDVFGRGYALEGGVQRC